MTCYESDRNLFARLDEEQLQELDSRSPSQVRIGSPDQVGSLVLHPKLFDHELTTVDILNLRSHDGHWEHIGCGARHVLIPPAGALGAVSSTQDSPNNSDDLQVTVFHPHTQAPSSLPTCSSGFNAGFPGPLNQSMEDSEASIVQQSRQRHPWDDAIKPEKLGQWKATSICGNDITSSCFYMVGPIVSEAGIWAPISALAVSTVLYMYRSIYGEAITALPLNGGAYNVLLNSTSKATASLAATLTILSYTATAVVSASTAASYGHNVWAQGTDSEGTELYLVTIGILFVFATLSFLGLGESAGVALGIFIFHLYTMIVLLMYCMYYLIANGVSNLGLHRLFMMQPHIGLAVFHGFSQGLLGVSGFETSANYVEEQKPGVFTKTLRNMWSITFVLNPLLVLMCVLICDAHQVTMVRRSDAVALLAERTGGYWLAKMLSLDAFIVLAGSVLTSYVGIIGLVRRLALDRCLPGFFLSTNKWRGTQHIIILGFFILTSSLFLILQGDAQSLADTYSVAFCSVMVLFAIGNMLMKYKRPTLKAQIHSSWGNCIIAMLLVMAGLVGTIVRRPKTLAVFTAYFALTLCLVGVMQYRVFILKLTIYSLSSLRWPYFKPHIKKLKSLVQVIRHKKMAFFCNNGDISVINKAILYVRQNEECGHLHIIHCFVDEPLIPPTLYRDVSILGCQYPKLKLDLILVKGSFTPKMVSYISYKLGIPHNLFFITCPSESFAVNLDELGGVRLITH